MFLKHAMVRIVLKQIISNRKIYIKILHKTIDLRPLKYVIEI